MQYFVKVCGRLLNQIKPMRANSDLSVFTPHYFFFFILLRSEGETLFLFSDSILMERQARGKKTFSWRLCQLRIQETMEAKKQKTWGVKITELSSFSTQMSPGGMSSH